MFTQGSEFSYFDKTLYTQAWIEGASAATSVTAYHPFRTLLVQGVTNSKINLNPKTLYRGFTSGLASSHQLFLMGYIHNFLKTKWSANRELTSSENMAIGACAGLGSAPTVCPFELYTTRQQLEKDCPNLTDRKIFRGFTLMALRQMGLGACMFSLPPILNARCLSYFPSVCRDHEKGVKIGASFISGAMGALLTQIPETGRILMQRDLHGEQYQRSVDAIKVAARDFTNNKGFKMMGLRLIIVGIATSVMNQGREFYTKIAKGGAA